MKTYEEMADSALLRIKNYETEQKRRKKTVIKIAIPAVSLCLAATLSVGVWKSGMFKSKTPVTNDVYTASDVVNSPDEEAQDNSSKKSGSETAMDVIYFWWKNKLNISGTLHNAIENSPESKFSVTATYCPTTAYIASFTYKGKTLAQWAVAADDETMMPEKMAQLLKEGDSLKYGEALYNGDAPNGEKWAKSLYDERIAFYGKELLEKYIVNGEFLRDTLEKDIAEYNEYSARKGYKRAFIAYMETVMPETVKKLSKNNIKCERTAHTNNALTLFVSANELENLPLENLKDWYFDLAVNDRKGTSDHTEDLNDRLAEIYIDGKLYLQTDADASEYSKGKYLGKASDFDGYYKEYSEVDGKVYQCDSDPDILMVYLDNGGVVILKLTYLTE